MGRPTKQEKRECQLNVKLTRRERDWLDKRAADMAMPPVDYARAQLLAARPVRPRRADASAHILDPLFLLQLSKLGNNLNQMARKFHQLDQLPPPSLEPLLRLILELIRKGARGGS